MKKTIFIFLSFLPGIVFAASDGHLAPHLKGGDLSVIWVIPFAGILLSIAIFPLLASRFWHHNFGKVSAFWAILLLLPMVVKVGFSVTVYELLHVFLLEYIPFIILLLALFTIAGGVRIKGSLRGTPVLNLAILIIGTLLASWMGTTGAAMLLIRPLIRANSWRKKKTHVVIFFIFLVANVGGSLTPLGDPPLFLGFLKGIDFFWTTSAMFVPMMVVSIILWILFYFIDSFYMKQEPNRTAPLVEAEHEKLGLEGSNNLIILAFAVGAVLMSGIWNPHISFSVYHVEVELQNLSRDLLLLALTFTSWSLTSIDIRKRNQFTWFPIQEVAKLFAGIFVTIIPAIAILKAGKEGALSSVVGTVSTSAGDPINVAYFWATGILSSFLDNAPTYLVFFNTAGGDPIELMGDLHQTLLAISAGAVFMGANTYIGNAPNFMVKAIAEEQGIEMPSFFGYMIKYSVPILIPIFFLVSWIFFL
ncbi:MAG: sodium:proton antiporter [Candidatus Neomarinimicrobiota bacterium]